MKRILLIFVLGMMLQSFSYGQSCLPNGIHFGNQAEIDNFPLNYPGCTIIEGDVGISEVGGIITNLDSLIVLTEIHGALRIGGVAAMSWPLENLTSLNGLNNLTSIDSTLFIGTTKLSSLNGLEQLTAVGGNLFIGSEGWINAHNPYLKDISALSNLSSIEGSLFIEYNDSLVTLTGLEGLNTVGGDVIIGRNNSLFSLDGLDNLTTIMGGLYIGTEGIFSLPNPSLVNIAGLNGLSSIGGGLFITNNDSLISLTGLEGLTNITGDLVIGDNYSLISLTGLNNLSDIGGYLSIGGNNVITSLTGLENLSSIGNDLYINDNPLLSTCAISGICDYLDIPNGTIYINNNATGCNSEQEVDSICGTLIIEEVDLLDGFKITPNPANTFIEITNEQNLKITQVNIYNQLGQLLIKRDNTYSPIDISILSTGIYIVEIVADRIKVRKKLIVN
ncbi:MAG: T9SS type A sorting domain-containing protein [Bacteroidales bacterium]|nr:T9SS type A sorting domain-containing protein [Bacteroidales bacterium]MCF8454278.1 T9SS type A sorting domain-containing protein [Bacteroidales bacterium]